VGIDTPLPEDLAGELTALVETVAARPDHADVARKLEWLIDAFILRGQLPESFRALARKIRGERSGVRLAVFRDKYAVASPPIDCAERIPLCGARCCSFEVTLSAQDVAERVLPFDIHEPYRLPRDERGRCACMDDAGACTVYAQRPGACRAYDCRHDARVWLAFDARLPAPRSSG
jgi:hypothetical protein